MKKVSLSVAAIVAMGLGSASAADLGKVYTKDDLLEEARSGHMVYERQEDSEGRPPVCQKDSDDHTATEADSECRVHGGGAYRVVGGNVKIKI